MECKGRSVKCRAENVECKRGKCKVWSVMCCGVLECRGWNVKCGA